MKASKQKPKVPKEPKFYICAKYANGDVNPSKKTYSLEEAKKIRSNISSGLSLVQPDVTFYIARPGFLWFPCEEDNFDRIKVK